MDNSLVGLKILVTRPAHQAEPLCRLIESRGGLALRLPTLEIVAIEPHLTLETDSSIIPWEVAIFVSTNAVEYALPLLQKLSPQLPPSLKIMAVGQGTAARLTEKGWPVLRPQPPYNSEALLASPELQAIAGQKIVIFRGEGGRALLAETLRQRGAQVDYINVYRRVQPPPPPVGTLTRPDVMIVTSNDSLHHLLTMLQDFPWVKQTPLVVMSERVQQEARTLGLQVPILIAPVASDEGLLQALLHGKINSII